MSNGARTDLFEVEQVENPDIAAKQDAVVRAGLAFTASIHDAEAEGRGTLKRAVSGLRPALMGVGLLAAVGVGIALARRSPAQGRHHKAELGHAFGSWSNLGRAVAVAFAAAAGRRLVDSWLRSKSIDKPNVTAARKESGEASAVD